ncbi:hypothetical protein LZ30DRAFT_254986 [Colletotrichum cereale]|nr:hypothetical protein LZ30DRAFT_254986 [Colletotrichum cereale]
MYLGSYSRTLSLRSARLCKYRYDSWLSSKFFFQSRQAKLPSVFSSEMESVVVPLVHTSLSPRSLLSSAGCQPQRLRADGPGRLKSRQLSSAPFDGFHPVAANRYPPSKPPGVSGSDPLRRTIPLMKCEARPCIQPVPNNGIAWDCSQSRSSSLTRARRFHQTC